MTDALGMNVGYGSEQLVRVKFHQQVWHHLLHLQVLLHYSVCCIRDEVHHHIQVDFFGLVTIGIE